MNLKNLFKGKNEEQQAQQQQPIGEKEIGKALEILMKYKEGKANLDKRIIENEQWYKMRHWEQIRDASKNPEPEPASAWLFNSIANKHADAMDNFPEPSILPREEGDQPDAEMLTSIVPCVLERNEFEQTYDDAWWYKLKTGTGAYGVFWNTSLENGLGDIDIKMVDILNMFWQPGIKDIQNSPHLFNVELVENEILEQEYPEMIDKLGSGDTIEVGQYVYDDEVDNSTKSAVVDWYYKKSIQTDTGSRQLLHFCKFCNGVVLSSTENDPELSERGLYDHGEYPFELDVLFTEEGTPCGFGYIDIMKDCQMYIDKLNQIIIKHAFRSGNPKWFVADSVDINMSDVTDDKIQFIKCTGQIDDTRLKQWDIKPLDHQIIQHLQSKIEELKETSQNRDFSQGSTASGVTAASAIAALQEAGNKGSRDMIKSSYRTFTRIVYLCIELIRQFYTEPRSFRIIGESGATKYIQYQNQSIQEQELGQAFGEELGFRKPIFDIKVKSHKSSPFSRVAQNELAKELYSAGFFNPQIADQALVAMDMMDFEGKNATVKKISENASLYSLLQQMIPMAQIIDAQNGSNMTDAIAQQLGMPMPQQQTDTSTVTDTNALGKAVQTSQSNTATKAKERAANTAMPK
ncbi:MAG TPA: hypothetical protein VJY37_01405 [Anaerovoracaceae bacterium]|nr:hypothetical protein [Anaerovoracaceae bacterium]